MDSTAGKGNSDKPIGHKGTTSSSTNRISSPSRRPSVPNRSILLTGTTLLIRITVVIRNKILTIFFLLNLGDFKINKLPI